MRVQDAAKLALWRPREGEELAMNTEPLLPVQSQPLPSGPPHPTTSPAHQPRGPGAKAVHEDPQGQGGGTEHEGADGEAQVEHLFLAVTAQPLALLIPGGVGDVC